MGAGGSRQADKPVQRVEKALSLAKKGLLEVPLSMVPRELGGVEEVWLQDNQLTVVPEWAAGMTNLALFYVMNNQLNDMPAWTKAWVSLEELNIR